jgi:ferredoxin
MKKDLIEWIDKEAARLDRESTTDAVEPEQAPEVLRDALADCPSDKPVR